MNKYQEQVYWNSRTYGSAIKINKRYLQALFIFLCICTPATNWLIPLVVNRFKDIVWRY